MTAPRASRAPSRTESRAVLLRLLGFACWVIAGVFTVLRWLDIGDEVRWLSTAWVIGGAALLLWSRVEDAHARLDALQDEDER